MGLVTEVVVPVSDKARFWSFFQDYLTEHATFTGKTPVNGEFAYPGFDLYWTERDGRWPFWAMCGDEIAGLALVRRNDDDNRLELAEFYVRPAFRRQGLGFAFARRLLARFPGQWQLNQAQSNTNAIAFWHRVLDGYVHYTETSSLKDVARLEQRFTIG